MPPQPGNSQVSKLLSARPRLGAALQDASTTPFTPEMIAAMRQTAPKPPSNRKKKGPVAAALSTLQGEF